MTEHPAEQSSPRLVEAASGETHRLTGRVVTIGAARECGVRLVAAGAAPRAAHCLFSGGRYHLQPLSEEARVSVNGTPVSGRQPLAHGDTVVVEGQSFRYLEQPDQPSGPAARTPLEELVGVVTVLLQHRDRDVAADLVASVSRLLRCDAARLLSEDAAAERATVARFPESSSLDRFSNRAIDWARDAARTVLMREAEWCGQRSAASSLEQNAVGSLLCAPLRRGEQLLGYLYLDRLRLSPPFGEEDRTFCDALLPLFCEMLANADERRRQREAIERLQSARNGGGMIHECPRMAAAVGLARRFAATTSPVLILGETGTGKELAARLIHESSARASGQFRAINCGAIPENLMESELFGHEKGAFTGASARKLGLLESAAGGTVLLDEVGELPLALQVKLLRVLQEAEIVRVGGNETIAIDVRILAATNRDLGKEVTEGRFRQDLYYRLNVLTLTMPPLREREADVVLLAEYFTARYCEQFGLPPKSLTAAARGRLLSHSWPGNIRELENIVQKAVLLSAGSRIDEVDLALTAGESGSSTGGGTIRQAREGAERDAIAQALRKTKGNVSQAARLLSMDRKWLMKKMADLAISADSFRC